MTLRARPVARRRGRAGWDSGDRRNTLINLGFFLAIGLSALILVGYAAWSWYDDHFGAAAIVDGQVITKDDLRNRLEVESFRLDYVERRIQTLMALGRISSADGEAQLQSIGQLRQQIASLALERLVDGLLQGKLAAENGVTVTEEDVDAQMLESATTSEQRHTWMIEIEPVVNPDTDEVGDEERRAALVRAQQALGRLKAGETWEDVARTASDSANAPQGGDLGWLAEDSGYDEAFMAAVFAVDSNVPTTVVEGEDGVFRIGRQTELAPEDVDESFEAAVVDAGVTVADYRVAARGDVLREKLSEKVVADLSKPGPQRHVLQIFLPEPNTPAAGETDGVKVRHIVFAPNDDSSKADELPADDPAWVKAKAEADAAYAELKANPDKFDAMAREESDEGSASVTGGKQPWYYASSSVDEAFKAAIMKEGLTPGQLLEPVKTAFGWHVIQFMRPLGEGEKAWMESLKGRVTTDASFRQVAKDTSEGDNAEDGGDLGWIAAGQLEDQLDAAVYSTAVGALTAVIEVSGSGTYLFRIVAEETREPTEEQLKIFEENGFNYWYTKKKEAANIEYKLGVDDGHGLTRPMLDALVAEARDRWGLDVSAGIQVVASEGLVDTPIEASRPLLIVPLAWLRTGSTDDASDEDAEAAPAATALPGRHGAEGRDPIRVLQRLYPGAATVARLEAATADGTEPAPEPTTIAQLTVGDLEIALYVPPIAPELAAAGPWSMPYISHRLRQPDGCPWDREQTHASLRKHLLEETYEVYDALEHGATPALAEELGDLLLQIVLHAQLAAEAGVFDLADVQASIARKIVRRHPHVFGDAVARTSADVNRQWERIKAGEREAAALEAGPDATDGSAAAPKSALDGISPSMPALAAGQEMQERAAALGYDWPSIDGVLDKVAEELGELARAASPAERSEEFGDLLLVAVNVGRKLGIEAEAALRASNAKFRSRFGRVERMARERGVALRDLDFAALDDLWDAAKAEERAEATDPPLAVGNEGVR